jgi:hypothetical protein
LTAAERLAALPPDARAAALAAMDEISRPLDVRDLDVAMARHGVPRSQRRPMIRALLGAFDVIALVPRQ